MDRSLLRKFTRRPSRYGPMCCQFIELRALALMLTDRAHARDLGQWEVADPAIAAVGEVREKRRGISGLLHAAVDYGIKLGQL